MLCCCSIYNSDRSSTNTSSNDIIVVSQSNLLFQTMHSFFLFTRGELAIVHMVLFYLLFALFSGFVFVVINGLCQGLMPFDGILVGKRSLLYIEQQPGEFCSIGQSHTYFTILAVNSLKSTGWSEPTCYSLQNLVSFYSFLEQQVFTYNLIGQ